MDLAVGIVRIWIVEFCICTGCTNVVTGILYLGVSLTVMQCFHTVGIVDMSLLFSELGFGCLVVVRFLPIGCFGQHVVAAVFAFWLCFHIPLLLI